MEENENSADLGISSTLSGESEQRFHVKNKMTPSKCKPAHPTWCKKKLDLGCMKLAKQKGPPGGLPNKRGSRP